MGLTRLFTLDSIPHRCPDSNPPSPPRFNNDEGRETDPISYRVSRCWKFICSFTVLDLPDIPGQNEKH